MLDPNRPITATKEQEEPTDSLVLQELQELLDDKEEYLWG
jgi:hypothetical protein